jgi:hypothetical protein
MPTPKTWSASPIHISRNTIFSSLFCDAMCLLRRLQLTLRPSRRRIRSRLPLLAAPLRSRPLSGLALPARGDRRPHRHLGRACHRPAALVRPSRLSRRNRRTFTPLGRPVTCISRTSTSARTTLAAGRACRTPPPGQLPRHRKEKRPRPYLQSLRSPCFSGRYSIDGGVTESRCS